jgi:hypothetical protein
LRSGLRLAAKLHLPGNIRASATNSAERSIHPEGCSRTNHANDCKYDLSVGFEIGLQRYPQADHHDDIKKEIERLMPGYLAERKLFEKIKKF